MSKGEKSKKSAAQYAPSYPTTIGTDLPDKTFQQLPAYSMRPMVTPINKKYSPGPAAYPNVEPKGKSQKKTFDCPRSLYPQDQGHKYSMGITGNQLKTAPTPGPARYPTLDPNDKKKETVSMYPKEEANQFSISPRRDEKLSILSPGPASYPRDVGTKNINSLHPDDQANKYSIRFKYDDKNAFKSPGPAVYPNLDNEVRNPNIISTIYPKDKRLPPTIKFPYNTPKRERIPAPNTYPALVDKTYDPKKPMVDVVKKVIPGKKSPKYSFGIRHIDKQQILVLKDDEY